MAEHEDKPRVPFLKRKLVRYGAAAILFSSYRTCVHRSYQEAYGDQVARVNEQHNTGYTLTHPTMTPWTQLDLAAKTIGQYWDKVWEQKAVEVEGTKKENLEQKLRMIPQKAKMSKKNIILLMMNRFFLMSDALIGLVQGIIIF